MSALFPIVPALPGVPAVLRGIGQIETGVAQINGLLGQLFGERPVWELFNEDGDPIADYDNMLGVEPRKEYRIGTYPVEEGEFQSYSKVELPFEGRIVLACGGDQDRRQQFISDIDLAASSLQLYTLATPDHVIENLNVVRYEYERTAQNGCGLVIIALYVLEVRDLSEATYADTKSPAGADMQDGGSVQAQDADGDDFDNGTGTAEIGADGLAGPVPGGLVAREASPAAEATDEGLIYNEAPSDGLPYLY